MGDRGSGPPPSKITKIVFLRKTGPNPLKNYKATNLDSMMARLKWYLDPLSDKKKKKKKKKKNVFCVGPHLTNLSGSAHGVSY